MPKAVDKEVNSWMEEINLARAQRKPYLVHWNYWEGVYDDNLWGNATFEKRARRQKRNDPNFLPQVNELESIVMNILPKVHFYSPVFEIQPVPGGDIFRFSAAVYEVLARVLYDTLDIYDIVKEIVIDTLILGGGVHKSGYFYELESSAYQSGDATAGEPEIHDEMVFSGYVTPLNVLVDYRVKNWKDKRWMAEEIIKPVDEVKKSGLYSHTRDLVGNLTSVQDLTGVARRAARNKKGDLVRLIEVHDLANSKILTVAEGHNRLLRKDDDYDMEIYDQLTFTPTRPRRVWGKSMAQSIEEHMIEIAKIHYYMSAHSKRAGLTKVMIDNRVPKSAQKAIKSSRDFELIPVDDLSGSPPVQELKFSQVGMDWYANLNIKEAAVRFLSGVTMQERGRHEPGVETAYETARLMEASSTRNNQRTLELNKFVAKVMTRLLKIVSNNFHPTKICHMVGIGPESAYMILPFDRMNLNVKYGSTAMGARQDQLRRVFTALEAASNLGIQLDPNGALRLIMEASGLEFRESLLLTGQPAAEGGGTPVTRPPGVPAASRRALGTEGGEAFAGM